jgi:hypothetical protein
MAFVLHPIKLEVNRLVPVPPDFEEFDLMDATPSSPDEVSRIFGRS